MTKDLLSVIVPVYNTDKYLSDCLETISTQSYGNMDVILVDDGSTDSFPMICDGYSKKDRHVKCFHRTNEGVSAARNFGLMYASSSYIAFADSDDVLGQTNV